MVEPDHLDPVTHLERQQEEQFEALFSYDILKIVTPPQGDRYMAIHLPPEAQSLIRTVTSGANQEGFNRVRLIGNVIAQLPQEDPSMVTARMSDNFQTGVENLSKSSLSIAIQTLVSRGLSNLHSRELHAVLEIKDKTQRQTALETLRAKQQQCHFYVDGWPLDRPSLNLDHGVNEYLIEFAKDAQRRLQPRYIVYCGPNEVYRSPALREQ